MAFIVAIDGPVGSGKSSVARAVAKANSLTHVDTGSIYRAIAYVALQEGKDMSQADEMTQLTQALKIDMQNSSLGTRLLVNAEDVTDKIRTEAVSQGSSLVSQHAGVRSALLELQRKLGRRAAQGAVLEGRDIGTVVFPDAVLKIFLTADDEERARRRFLELRAKNENVTFETVLDDLKMRDVRDKNRVVAPLKAAEDAIVLDTTHMGQDEVVDVITAHIAQKKQGKEVG